MLFPSILAFALSLNGSWDFRFEEGKALEDAPDAGFAATDVIPVPACYDTMPKWYMKRGTGLYRRTFTLDIPKSELPPGKTLTFAVRPLTSLGTFGKPIATEFKV